jgi:hypothetical protein
VHRFLASIGAPVPALYDADPARRAMLVEDVGTISLLDARPPPWRRHRRPVPARRRRTAPLVRLMA